MHGGRDAIDSGAGLRPSLLPLVMSSKGFSASP
jgi:hypothetical protein